MGDDFYVFLTSNIKTEKGSQNLNTIGNFITNLPHKLQLNDDYEVAISDISYTKSWYNVPRPQKISLQILEGDPTLTTQILLPAGDYAKGEYLAHAINKLIERKRESSELNWLQTVPRVIYESKTNKFKIEYGKTPANPDESNSRKNIMPFFSETLSDIMGFFSYSSGILMPQNFAQYKEESIHHSSTSKTLEANYVPQMTSIHTIYVYSDIIRPRIVGNVMAPLFRQIEVPKDTKFGEDVFIKYRKRFYHPLNHFEFDTIQVNFKDDTGKDIDFMLGRSTVSLHFRKITNIDRLLKSLKK